MSVHNNKTIGTTSEKFSEVTSSGHSSIIAISTFAQLIPHLLAHADGQIFTVPNIIYHRQKIYFNGKVHEAFERRLWRASHKVNLASLTEGMTPSSSKHRVQKGTLSCVQTDHIYTHKFSSCSRRSLLLSVPMMRAPVHVATDTTMKTQAQRVAQGTRARHSRHCTQQLSSSTKHEQEFNSHNTH